MRAVYPYGTRIIPDRYPGHIRWFLYTGLYTEIGTGLHSPLKLTPKLTPRSSGAWEGEPVPTEYLLPGFHGLEFDVIQIANNYTMLIYDLASNHDGPGT